MPELVLPTATVHASFLAAMDEFVAEGARDSQTAAWIEHQGPGWQDPEVFADFVTEVIADAEEDRPRPARYVPSTTLWWIDGDAYLGRLAIRHRLNDFLLDVGGHIGYDVRPSARRQGHATAMLRAALPWARGWASTRRSSPATTTTSARSGSSRPPVARWRTYAGRSAATGCPPADLRHAVRPGIGLAAATPATATTSPTSCMADSFSSSRITQARTAVTGGLRKKRLAVSSRAGAQHEERQQHQADDRVDDGEETALTRRPAACR